MRWLAFITLSLALAGCQTAENKDTIVLNLSSSGEVKVVPDMASLLATISCTNKNLTFSTNCTKRGIDTLFQLLEQNGVEKKDYHSSRIELEKEYTWRNNSNVFNGYKSSSTISMVFRDLDAMGQVITQTMTMKDVSLYGLSYSHSKIDDLVQQAYLLALDNTNQLAEKMKEKTGGKSLEIMEIMNTTGDFVTQVTTKQLEKREGIVAARTRSAPIQINPGELTLTKEVQVLYRVYR